MKKLQAMASQTKNPVESMAKCVNKIEAQKTDKKKFLVKKRRLPVFSTNMWLKYLQFRVASSDRCDKDRWKKWPNNWKKINAC